MKPIIRELLADFKAAMLISSPGALAAVLDRIRHLSDTDFPAGALLPLGSTLSARNLSELMPLLEDPDPAIRGIGAVAIASKAGSKPNLVPLEMMLYAADEHIPEIRNAYAEALFINDVLTSSSIEAWLQSSSTNVQQTALQALHFARALDAIILKALEPLDAAPDYDFRTQLVATVSALAEAGHADSILALLGEWSQRSEPNIWVVTRILSASWALQHSDAAVKILNRLTLQVGENRAITRTLARHDHK